MGVVFKLQEEVDTAIRGAHVDDNRQRSTSNKSQRK
jgi:hypothetical protein